MIKNTKTSDTQRKLVAGASVLAAAAAALAGAPAFAQDTDSDDEIVVTGSRIARSDATSALPVTVVSREAIQNAGVIGIGEILRQDPAISGGGFGQSNILSGGGAQTVDLRNLGTNRTLVLINGQRYSLFTDSLQNEGQDLGLLPASMIERVEILRDGAATAYGADAVAGVVNFILREDFNGLDVSGLYSITGEGDGEQMRIGLTAGASSDRGSALISMEYLNRDSIAQTDRSGAFMNTPFGGGINAAPFATVGSGIGGPQIRTTAGGLIAAYGVFGGTCPADCGGATTQRYNYALDQDIVGAQEGYNISFNGSYDITPDIEFKASAIYGSRFSEYGLAANPISANSPSGPFNAGVRVPVSAANNYGQVYSFTWRPVPYGNRQNTVDASQLWVTAGLEGTIAEDYTWDVNLARSEVDANNRTAVVPNIRRLATLLDPAGCAADPVCAGVGSIPNHVAFWSNAAPLTAAQRNYVFYTQSSNSRFITETASASLSGPLFQLPAGMVDFAVGAEYRSEFGEAIPDTVTASGESIANATNPTRGDYDTFELFAELNVPILSNVPGAQELTLNLQGRRSDFSNFGTAETWKAGLVWEPIDDLRVRANIGTSFRAPNVTELFSLGIQSFNAFADPCTTGTPGGTSTGAVLNPIYASACAALGVPTSYVQPASQLRNLSGGNPDLQPEEGESYTVGLVYQPSFFDPLTLTVDYWNFEVERAIVTQGLQAPWNACYASATFSAASFLPGGSCFQFGQRTPAGIPTALTRIQINGAGVSTTDGVDFTITLNFPEVGPGDLTAQLRGSHVMSAVGPLFFGGTFESVGYLDGLGGTGFPENRLTFDADYEIGDWRFSWQTRYTSEMLDPNCQTPRGATGGAVLTAGNFLCGSVVSGVSTNLYNYIGVDEYYLHDARVRFSGGNYNLTVGVNNVLDEEPPLAINTGNNTYPALYDVIGRSFFVGLSARF